MTKNLTDGLGGDNIQKQRLAWSSDLARILFSQFRNAWHILTKYVTEAIVDSRHPALPCALRGVYLKKSGLTYQIRSCIVMLTKHPTLVRKEHRGAFFKDLFTRNTTDGIDGDDFSWYHTITSPRSGRKTQRGVLIEAVI